MHEDSRVHKWLSVNEITRNPLVPPGRNRWICTIAEWPIRLERNKAAACCWAPTCLLAHTVLIAHSQRKIQTPNRSVLP